MARTKHRTPPKPKKKAKPLLGTQLQLFEAPGAGPDPAGERHILEPEPAGPEIQRQGPQRETGRFGETAPSICNVA